MDVIWIVLAVAGAVAGLGAMMLWQSHNRLMQLDERCEAAFADIDVQLRRRHAIIPNLVETVRGLAAHEAGILNEVVRARAASFRASDPEMRMEAETALGQSVNTILSVAERYPDIAASSHFRDLRMELLDAENKIAAARRFHNLAVSELNATARQLPGALVARFASVAPRKGFDIGIERVMLDEPPAIKL
jgi:LemA protein